MKRRMEVSQHCWKFIYKHSDISIFAVCHLFYFLYLHRCGKNIFTNKFSSSGIYRYLNSSVRRVKLREKVPTAAAVHDFCRFRGVPKVQPTEDTQTMTHARSTISLVVRVISRSKNNFYDVIRLKIIESRYFSKETVKVGLEKKANN